ncbi:MAG: transketolase [Candidatus Neomarinimicrobiota bacterium]|nr:MAG: transketolase [Candidatus Neomarinimicrobiota bacterium]
MPIVDSKTGKVVKEYNAEELKRLANIMRGYNLISLCAAGSGHLGGTMSIMDIVAVLYLKEIRHDPKNPDWPDRDRVIFSTGHKAPALYIGLGMSGYFNVEDVVTLRKLFSPFQGHPHWLKCKGVEFSTGSLGQGLSISVGQALAGKLDGKDYRVYCIMGDGEQQEGQIWEAILEAGHYKLDNLCGIIDFNKLQIDGWVKDVMNIEPIEDKYRAFGWEVIRIDGHNIDEIIQAFDKARKIKGKPTVIVADTIKGKGVSYAENIAGWHGKAPNYDLMIQGLEELGLKNYFDLDKLFKKANDYQTKVDEHLDKKVPKFSRNYWWNEMDIMKVEMEPTRKGFGNALEKVGDDPRIVCLGADISGSITISKFYENHPERKHRFLSMGISEQSMTCVAAGLSKEGKLPVIGTYGVFASARNLDQLRTTVCYGNHNVFVAGAHGGVSVGPDGATHQALEEFFNICGLPNMHVVAPCDAVEVEKATKYLLFEINGPKYIRFAREATPVVTDENTVWIFGKANVIRFRGERDNFKDAFEHILASEYENENEDLTIIACGPMVPEAMRAAYILKKEYDLETRVINMHTVKPIDREAIVRAAKETGIILTVEEHQKGGFGNWVSAVLSESPEVSSSGYLFRMMGVSDRFGESGAPWELVKEFELSAEFIAKNAKLLIDRKKEKV